MIMIIIISFILKTINIIQIVLFYLLAIKMSAKTSDIDPA